MTTHRTLAKQYERPVTSALYPAALSVRARNNRATMPKVDLPGLAETDLGGSLNIGREYQPSRNEYNSSLEIQSCPKDPKD